MIEITTLYAVISAIWIIIAVWDYESQAHSTGYAVLALIVAAGFLGMISSGSIVGLISALIAIAALFARIICNMVKAIVNIKRMKNDL